jgi:tetratricopeptide (TPR) repeat protein
MKKNNISGSLRITLLAGIILLVMSGIALAVFILIDRNTYADVRQKDSFNRILREYDEAFANLYLTEREFDRLNGELDHLEKKAIGVESWLSIIKRRRALTFLHPPSNEKYKTTVEKAYTAYPSSEAIIAVAAALNIKNKAANRETEARIREWLSLLNDVSYNNLRLAFHVILGDLNSPEKAMELPSNIFTDGTEVITVNLALLKTLREDYREALSDVQLILNSHSPSVNALRFAAEYHYDFGDLLRSAEIFSMINDEKAMIRQADALFLAGYTQMAAALWNILASLPHETSLYNLAVSSETQEEALVFLNKLINIETVSNKESRQFGLIRYSRFLDYNFAVSLLQNTVKFSPAYYPYIDLEICKRNAKEQILGRQIAETWFLLDRHEENEDLYRWAFWHFFFQRNYDEIKILLERMNIIALGNDWVDVYKAIYLMSEGNLNEAESILIKLSKNDAPWYIYANLGRILETYRSLGRAAEQYEIACAKTQNPKTSARIQLQIARCLTSLNKPVEARRAYQYALELDPDNLSARLELSKGY